MTFEADWAELKRESSARTSRAGAGGEGWNSDGGAGDLRSSRQAWSRSAQAVGSLRGNLKSALRALESRHDVGGSGGSEAEGLRSVASHLSAYQSWQRRLDLVSRECDELKDKLQKTGDAFYKTDAAIGEAFHEQKTVPVKRPGAGSHGRGES